MKSKITTLLVLLLLLAGCSSTKKVDTAAENTDYIIKINGIAVNIGEELKEDVISKEKDSYEVVNCALGDTNIVHIYDGAEITTYTKDNKNLVYSIVFTDPSAVSADGLKIGLSKDEVTAILKDGYDEEGTLITKNFKKHVLSVVLKDEAVIGIEYTSNN